MTRSQTFFCLALLLHLLLFLSFSLSLQFQTQPEIEADKYLPAYLFSKETSDSTPPDALKNTANAEVAIKKQVTPDQKAENTHHEETTVKAVKALRYSDHMEPENLMDAKPISDPLIKQMSKSIASKLSYPPKAVAFRLKGTVQIGFQLNPNGEIVDVTILQSSGFPILDDAAVSAIKAVSPVRDAILYLNKPRLIQWGIIFG